MSKLMKNREFWLALALAVLIWGVTLRAPGFGASSNLLDIFNNTSILVILALGQMVVIDPLYRSINGRHPCLIRDDCSASECCIPWNSRTDLTSYRSDKRRNPRRRQRPAGLETQHPIDCCHIGYTYHIPRYNFSYCGWPMGQRGPA